MVLSPKKIIFHSSAVMAAAVRYGGGAVGRLRLLAEGIQHSARAPSRRASTALYKSGRKFRESEEVRIPFPWGEVAGVWWGPRSQQPLLALHGWQDNAFSWRPLMELLPPDLSVLAIDFPGHGFSSPNPPGIYYHSSDNVMNIRRVVKHFGWKSVSLMGHSMGAIATFAYAALFPKEINLTIQLDNFHPITTRRKNSIQHMADSIDSVLVAEERNESGIEPPSYPEKELIERLHQTLSKSIDREACPVLLERGAAASSADPSKFYYTRDSRLKYGLYFGLSDEDVAAMTVRMVDFPMLVVKFKDAVLFEPKEKSALILKELQKSNKLLEYREIHGTHHAHLNHPELLAPLVIDFLQRNNKLK